MVDYIETFKSKHSSTFGISKRDKGGYQVWHNGCRIGLDIMSLQGSRQLIYDRLLGGMENDLNDLIGRMESLKTDISSLKTDGCRDMFNLAKFKKDS